MHQHNLIPASLRRSAGLLDDGLIVTTLISPGDTPTCTPVILVDPQPNDAAALTRLPEPLEALPRDMGQAVLTDLRKLGITPPIATQRKLGPDYRQLYPILESDPFPIPLPAFIGSLLAAVPSTAIAYSTDQPWVILLGITIGAVAGGLAAALRRSHRAEEIADDRESYGLARFRTTAIAVNDTEVSALMKNHLPAAAHAIAILDSYGMDSSHYRHTIASAASRYLRAYSAITETANEIHDTTAILDHTSHVDADPDVAALQELTAEQRSSLTDLFEAQTTAGWQLAETIEELTQTAADAAARMKAARRHIEIRNNPNRRPPL